MTSVNFLVFWTPSGAPLSAPNPRNLPSFGQNLASADVICEWTPTLLYFPPSLFAADSNPTRDEFPGPICKPPLQSSPLPLPAVVNSVQFLKTLWSWLFDQHGKYYRLCKSNVPLFEFPSFLLPSNLGQPCSRCRTSHTKLSLLSFAQPCM